MKRIIFILALLAAYTTVTAQQTVGLFQNSAESFNGYTLLAPNGTEEVYLIDNCGEKVHEWLTFSRPGLNTYLLENGNLLRTGKATNEVISGGGSGGVIQIISWEGDVIWEYTISSDTELQHHDVEMLPNGNILAVVWDSYTQAEAAAKGRSVSGETLWSDKIVEIQPDYENGTGTVVWEWKAWDHLVQEVNVNLSNYGIVSGHPELININYVQSDFTTEDWLHVNGVDYNPDLDQIIISVRSFGEFWVVDHSTTTAEAATSEGGNSGQGGNLLYRWGNPRTYNQGTEEDQILFGQHDARWIEPGLVDEGKIMVFNNQAGTLEGINYSVVEVIDPPINANNTYDLITAAFGPEQAGWRYIAPEPTDFYSQRVSGAHRLPNGNTFITMGTPGTLFEINENQEKVWEYINPAAGAGIIAQEEPAGGNAVFRAHRYAPDYPGLAGRDLTPQGYIETGSTFTCEIFLSTEDLEMDEQYLVYPNPSDDWFRIDGDERILSVELIDATGKLVKTVKEVGNAQRISVSELPEGLYFVRLILDQGDVRSQSLLIQR